MSDCLPDLHISPLALTDKPIIERLLQLYLHDFSGFASAGDPFGKVDEQGRFAYAHLDRYLQDGEREALLFRLGGDLAGKRLLLLGVAYRSGVADTRNSPGELFVKEGRRRGASIAVADPLVRHWPELNVDLPDTLPAPDGFDAVVFAVGHTDYRDLDVVSWLGEERPLVFDAANVLSVDTRSALDEAAIPVHSIGRGG